MFITAFTCHNSHHFLLLKVFFLVVSEVTFRLMWNYHFKLLIQGCCNWLSICFKLSTVCIFTSRMVIDLKMEEYMSDAGPGSGLDCFLQVFKYLVTWLLGSLTGILSISSLVKQNLHKYIYFFFRRKKCRCLKIIRNQRNKSLLGDLLPGTKVPTKNPTTWAGTTTDLD